MRTQFQNIIDEFGWKFHTEDFKGIFHQNFFLFDFFVRFFSFFAERLKIYQRGNFAEKCQNKFFTKLFFLNQFRKSSVEKFHPNFSFQNRILDLFLKFGSLTSSQYKKRIWKNFSFSSGFWRVSSSSEKKFWDFVSEKCEVYFLLW